MLSPFLCDFKITSPRGNRTLFGTEEFHGGIDMVPVGDKTVHAIADGEAISLYEKNGFGRYIRQTLDDGRRIYYAHLDSTFIGSRTRIKKGEPIGVMGSTGRVTGPHLHIELRVPGTTKESLDIAAFLGIENKVGHFTFFPDDSTVKALFDCGIISEENLSNWEMMLSGKAEIKSEYVRIIFDRCCDKIKHLQIETSKG